MLFYYQKNGHTFGPLIEREFHQIIKKGEITADTPVRTDAMSQWTNLEGILHSGVLEQLAERRFQRELAREESLRAVAFSNRPLSSLASEFGSGPLRAQAYGDYLERVFPLQGKPGFCVVFKNIQAQERATFHWQGKFKDSEQHISAAWLAFCISIFGWHALFMPKGDTRPDLVAFRTAHDFSRIAAQQYRKYLLLSKFIWLVGGLCLAVGLVLLLIAGGFFLASFDATAATSTLFWSGVLVGSSAALFVFSWKLLQIAKALRLPVAIRTIEKYPLYIQKIEWEDIS